MGRPLEGEEGEGEGRVGWGGAWVSVRSTTGRSTKKTVILPRLRPLAARLARDRVREALGEVRCHGLADAALPRRLAPSPGGLDAGHGQGVHSRATPLGSPMSVCRRAEREARRGSTPWTRPQTRFARLPPRPSKNLCFPPFTLPTDLPPSFNQAERGGARPRPSAGVIQRPRREGPRWPSARPPPSFPGHDPRPRRLSRPLDVGSRPPA